MYMKLPEIYNKIQNFTVPLDKDGKAPLVWYFSIDQLNKPN